jgi:hypothetical protein
VKGKQFLSNTYSYEKADFYGCKFFSFVLSAEEKELSIRKAEDTNMC